ncbi:MAG: hypothetical protein IJM25_09110 [Eubacterium sp.]|nr:hypothetical protein [Eubacterium sp.]
MKCYACGKEIGVNYGYCPHCGTIFGDAAGGAQPSQPAQPEPRHDQWNQPPKPEQGQWNQPPKPEQGQWGQPPKPEQGQWNQPPKPEQDQWGQQPQRDQWDQRPNPQNPWSRQPQQDRWDQPASQRDQWGQQPNPQNPWSQQPQHDQWGQPKPEQDQWGQPQGYDRNAWNSPDGALPNQGPDGGNPETRPEKKSRKGLIIGIISGVVVLAGAVVLLFVLGVFSSQNGKYSTQGSDGSKVSLEIDGESGTLRVGDEISIPVTVTFGDENVTLKSDTGSVTAAYDKSNKTITLQSAQVSELGAVSGSLDGTYTFTSAKMAGVTMDVATMSEAMKQMGYDYDISEFKITISGESATINLMGQGGTCSVSVSGNRITFSEYGRDFEGEYDKNKGTISIEQSGASLIFSKSGLSDGSSYVLVKE